jgi:hypothetical protein
MPAVMIVVGDSVRLRPNQVLAIPEFSADTTLSAAYLLGFVEDPEALDGPEE